MITSEARWKKTYRALCEGWLDSSRWNGSFITFAKPDVNFERREKSMLFSSSMIFSLSSGFHVTEAKEVIYTMDTIGYDK